MGKTDEIIKIHLPKLKHKVIDVIARRWSPRYFSDEKIPTNHIEQMIEAARLAPSGRNLQPWYFYYAQKPTSGYEKLEDCLSERNYKWAKSAPLLIVACIDTKEQSQYEYYDLGASVFSLVLQAHSLGYYCRQMALFENEKLEKLIDNDHKSYIILAIGKLGDYEKVEEDVLRKELEPKQKKEKIFKELK